MTVVLSYVQWSMISAVFPTSIVPVFNLLSILVNNLIDMQIVKLNIISLRFCHLGLNELWWLVDLERGPLDIVLLKLRLLFPSRLLKVRIHMERKTFNVVVLRVIQ